jgi:hypothetical protein
MRTLSLALAATLTNGSGVEELKATTTNPMT